MDQKQELSKLSVQETKDLWNSLGSGDAVCFDVDSTVIGHEGIDQLAEFCGVGPLVAAFTKKAMEGNILFEKALAERLDIIRPTRQQIQDCLASHPPAQSLTRGILELVADLRKRGVHVFLISGGFRIMIEPVAELLQLSPKDHVIANTIFFHDDDQTASAPSNSNDPAAAATQPKRGSYRGFDASEPTSASGGKAKAVRMVKDRYGLKKVVMVGDGVTDMEARPPADAFIGFGGVCQRERVKQGADWFVTSFDELIEVLEGKMSS